MECKTYTPSQVWLSSPWAASFWCWTPGTWRCCATGVCARPGWTDCWWWPRATSARPPAAPRSPAACRWWTRRRSAPAFLQREPHQLCFNLANSDDFTRAAHESVLGGVRRARIILFYRRAEHERVSARVPPHCSRSRAFLLKTLWLSLGIKIQPLAPVTTVHACRIIYFYRIPSLYADIGDVEFLNSLRACALLGRALDEWERFVPNSKSEIELAVIPLSVIYREI